ncbi:MAG TPA: hypothetical protein IGS40_06995 [Trichormus sp. M33_DOE_039]|nr:hypothetical protein [Trichormus sp. M33_DOE_039]
MKIAVARKSPAKTKTEPHKRSPQPPQTQKSQLLKTPSSLLEKVVTHREPHTDAELTPPQSLPADDQNTVAQPALEISDRYSSPTSPTSPASPCLPPAPLHDPRSLIQNATQETTPIPLPYSPILESRLGTSLDHLTVYAGTPEIAATLETLQASAATYNETIILADTDPDLATIAHEVIHAMQASAESSPSAAVILPTTASAEQEATRLTAKVVQPDADAAPIQVNTAISPQTIALLREVPPPTVGETAPPSDRFAATVEQTETPAPPTTTETPESTAQEQTEASLEGSEIAAVGGDLEEVPALEPPAPPEPGITAEDVAAREAELAAAETALADAADVDELVDAYATAPPTLKAKQYDTLGSDLDRLANEENNTFQAEVPTFTAELSGETDELPELQVNAPPQEDVSLEQTPPDPAPDPDIPPTPDPTAYTANNAILQALSRLSPDPNTDRATEIGDTLNQVRTTDEEVDTSPGEAPAVPLEGETDPERIDNQLQAGVEQADHSRQQAQQEVLTGPGPERVQPLVMNEEIPLGEINTLAVASPQPVEDVAAYTQMGLPPEVETAFDQNQQEVMQSSLGEAQSQIHQVTDARDQARQEQLDQAQSEAQAQTLQADTDQRQAVQAQREQIQSERQNTLQQQSQAVADIEQESEDQRRSDRDDIATRVQDDQAQIRTDYQQAERDAQAEVNTGEERAEERRRAAEREAENQSWWDRAVSFVREAFAALTSAITAIFNAVREAINSILDAVKAAAEALIDAAANFIKEAIAAFGDFLKALVDNLLGEIFPELAAALNRFIDQAVELAQQAVDAVAAELKAGINALVEGLRAGLNAVLDVLQAGLEFAINIMQAVLTGDWGALARLVLEAVLKVIGIDPAEFYAFIGQISDTFQAIIDDPGSFVSNLLDAVVLGVQNFADNFLTHLQAGIIGWLTGALGDIQIPQEFNLLGVLDLVRQILGLTGDLIRRIAVRILGERNVERIEFVWNYVQTLITDGWSALFEQITQDLANLRDMVLDQIKEFLLTQIITAAITKLVSLFNPVGAIVQLVLTAWNIYTFLRDNLQNLIQIVQTIVEGLAQIVNGVIEPAAQRVEQTLASLLPVAISFLANLLGIGGIANRVRQIISDIRERIENAIVNLIRRIGQTFRGGGQSTPAPSQQSADSDDTSATGPIDKPVTLSQEQHTISASVQGRNVEIIINSRRRGPLLNILDAAIAEVEQEENKARRGGGIQNLQRWSSLKSQLGNARTEFTETAILQSWRAAGQPEPFQQYVEVRINELVRIMRIAFREPGVKGLDALFAPDYNGPRFLPRSCRKGRWIRPNLYERGRSWQNFRDPIVERKQRQIADDVGRANNTNDFELWRQLKANHLIPDDAQIIQFKQQDVYRTDYDLDHNPSVVSHWNGSGNNINDNDRRDFYFDVDEDDVVTSAYNRSKGAREENRYVDFVESGFISELAEAGNPGARSMRDGTEIKPFLDNENGNPLS